MRVWLILATVVVIAVVMVYLVRSRRGDGETAPLAGPESAPTPTVVPDPALIEKLSEEMVVARPATKAGNSYLGGAPPLSPSYSWPQRNGKPLAFLACLDLAEIPLAVSLDWLPRTGFLLFFYDTEEQPWGFDPADRDGFATIYMPDAAQVETGRAASPPGPLAKDAVFPKRWLAFDRIQMPPAGADPRYGDLSDEAMEELEELRAGIYGNYPRHQIGGTPDAVQDPEMGLQAQLVTNGLYCGDSSGSKSPKAAQLRPGAADWRLLLQIDSDDDAKMMWGDAGMLYFWVRREDARQGKFDNSWVILQCH